MYDEGGRSNEKAKGNTLCFSGNKVAFSHVSHPQVAIGATYKTRSEGKRCIIEITYTDGPFRGTKVTGIYSVREDILKICFASKKQLPTKLEAGPKQTPAATSAK